VKSLKGTYIAVGIALLASAIALMQIAVPWFGWTSGLFPTPTITQTKPLEPVAWIFAMLGFIAVVFGLTEDPALRIFFSFIAVITSLAFVTSIITIDMVINFIKKAFSEV